MGYYCHYCKVKGDSIEDKIGKKTLYLYNNIVNVEATVLFFLINKDIKLKVLAYFY